MKRTYPAIAGALLLSLAAGCGDSDKDAKTASAGSSASATPSALATPTAAAQLSLRKTSLGRVLTDGNGMTLYAFDKDTTADSTCYDKCAAQWPPLLTSSQPAAKGLKGKVGVTDRKDSTFPQVTYMSHPLYYYDLDTESGDVKGQEVSDFWHVLDADGNDIESAEP